MSKIFGIGLNKTGTKTLAACMTILGSNHSPYLILPLLNDYVNRKDLTRICQLVEMYDSFEDWPWPLVYREMDELFPGSKFILTLRNDPLTWLKSLKNHAEQMNFRPGARRLAYGYDNPHGHEREHIRIYRQHKEEVIRYFTNRPDDLLVVNWEKGDGWEKICKFLRKDIPNQAFPHINKGDYGK